jgi:hypothetical protein
MLRGCQNAVFDRGILRSCRREFQGVQRPAFEIERVDKSHRHAGRRDAESVDRPPIQSPKWMGALRIGTMPDEETARAFDQARSEARLLHYGGPIVLARPWWYQENRRAQHRAIREGAAWRMVLGQPDPFPLIYANPLRRRDRSHAWWGRAVALPRSYAASSPRTP